MTKRAPTVFAPSRMPGSLPLISTKPSWLAVSPECRLSEKWSARFFGREPNTSQNPDEAVAIGATIQAGILSGRSVMSSFSTLPRYR